MLKSLLVFLTQNEEVWSANVLLAQVVQELADLINQIEATWQLTSTDQSGVVMEKSAIQEDLIDLTFSLASVLYTMAERTKNLVLQGKVNLSKSDLRRLSDGELAITGKNVLDLLNEYLPSMADYGIVSDDIEAMDTTLNRYKESLPVNRVTITGRKAANQQLAVLFASANDLLKKQLDKMINRYEKQNPEFYTSYKNTRMIVDYGIRHDKDDSSGTPPPVDPAN